MAITQHSAIEIVFPTVYNARVLCINRRFSIIYFHHHQSPPSN